MAQKYSFWSPVSPEFHGISQATCMAFLGMFVLHELMYNQIFINNEYCIKYRLVLGHQCHDLISAICDLAQYLYLVARFNIGTSWHD